MDMPLSMVQYHGTVRADCTRRGTQRCASSSRRARVRCSVRASLLCIVTILHAALLAAEENGASSEISTLTGAWATVQGDAEHTGRAPNGTAMVSTRIKRWTALPTAMVYFAPVADGRGTVYVPLYRDQLLYALRASDGTKLWSYKLKGFDVHTPTLSDDGRLFITCADIACGLFAVNASTGTELWRYAPDIQSRDEYCPPSVSDGLVYTANTNGTFHAFDAITGDIVWRYDDRSMIVNLFCSPTVATGVAVFPITSLTDSRGLAAFNASTGELTWTVNEMYDADYCTASVDINRGVLYTSGSGVAAVELLTGQVLWNVTWPLYLTVDAPSIHVTGSFVLVPVGSLGVFFLNADSGALLRNCSFVKSDGSPAAAHSGIILSEQDGMSYAAFSDGVRAMNLSSCNTTWFYPLKNAQELAIDLDGTLYSTAGGAAQGITAFGALPSPSPSRTSTASRSASTSFTSTASVSASISASTSSSTSFTSTATVTASVTVSASASTSVTPSTSTQAMEPDANPAVLSAGAIGGIVAGVTLALAAAVLLASESTRIRVAVVAVFMGAWNPFVVQSASQGETMSLLR